MSFDPSALQDIQPPDIVGGIAKGFQLKDMVDSQQLNALKLNKEKATLADDEKAKGILSGSKLNTAEGLAEAQEKLTKAGLPGKAMELRKYGQSVESGELELQLKKVELHSAAQDIIAKNVDGIWSQAKAMKDAKTPDGRPKYTDASIDAWIQGQLPLALSSVQSDSGLPDPVKKTALQGMQQFLAQSQGKVTFDMLTQVEQTSKQGAARLTAMREDLKAQTGVKREEAFERNINSEIAAREKAGGGRKAPAGFEWDPDKPDELRPIKGGPKDPNSKPWSGREKVFSERIVTSANEAARAISNITELPIGASAGVFGVGSSPGHGILASGRDSLRNKLTSQDAQDYNTMLSGVRRNLATIESVGLAPSGALTEGFSSLELRAGDSQLTKLRKLAEMRQIVDAGLEVQLADPAIPDSIKDIMHKVLDKVKTSVPYTQSDVTALQRAQLKNPDTTLQQLIKSEGLGGTEGDKTHPPDVQALLDKYK
jgi:hypothetical protein